MFSRGAPLWAVRVVSAALVESRPFVARDPSVERQTTLSFHLQRADKGESFGLQCRHHPQGDGVRQCFVDALRPDLVSSSAVLQGVFGDRHNMQRSRVRLTSINGFAGLTPAKMKSLLNKSRDVVVQCAVTTTTTNCDAEREAEGGDAAAQVVQSIPLPKVRRGRRRKEVVVDIAAAHAREAPPTTAEGAGVGRRTTRRGGVSSAATRPSKKRLRYSGRRAPNGEQPTPDTGSSVLRTTEEAHSPLPGASASDFDVNAAAYSALQAIAPVKPKRPRGRPPKRNAAALEPPQPQRVMEEVSVTVSKTQKDEPPNDLWFIRGEAEAAPETEGVETTESEAKTSSSLKRPSRRPRVAPLESTTLTTLEEAKGRRRRNGLSKAPKVPGRRGRPRKTPPTNELLATDVPENKVAPPSEDGEGWAHADDEMEL